MLISPKNISTDKIEFWLQKAHELKNVADLCWAVDTDVKRRSEEARGLGVPEALLQEANHTEREINWLYSNLAAFAVHYLAIGILIKRNPQRFLKDMPGHKITETLEECGIELTPIQRTILRRVESAFRWSGKHRQWDLALTAEEVLTLKSKYAAKEEVTLNEKSELDTLFLALKKIAIQESQTKD